MTYNTRLLQDIKLFVKVLAGVFVSTFLPEIAMAATANDAFGEIYIVVEEAATGDLARAICLVGGVISLGIAAANAKPVMAVMGIVLALFATAGPAVIEGMFGGTAGTALI